MDRYFKNCQKALVATDLHLTGIAAMFLASKYEEVMPLALKTVQAKIGHGKFSEDDIL